MSVEFTLDELGLMSEAIGEMIENMEEDGDESFKPFLRDLYSASRKIEELSAQLRFMEG
jgi:hypothetical protein